MKPKNLERALIVLTLAAGSLLVLNYFLVSLSRLSYPFDLEWMEGATADHVRRVLSGKRIYLPPSPYFIPFMYPPFYYYVGALFGKILGLNLSSLRLISLLSTLGTFYLLFFYLRKKTNRVWPGLISLFLYAGTFPLSGFWFDLARVDSLFLFLLFLSYVLLDLYPEKWGQTLAGISITAAAFTKQSGIGAFLVAAIFLLFYKKKNALPFVLTGSLGIALSYLSLQILSRGWFFYYVFFLPSKHPLRKEMILNFWKTELLASLPLAFSFAFLCAGIILLAKLEDGYIPVLIFVSFTGLSWISMIHSGSFKNDMMPAFLATTLIFGLSYKYIFEKENFKKLFFVVVFFQFILLLYNPFPQIPTKKDRLAGKRLFKIISRLEGEVYLPFHGFVPVMTGKKESYAHIMAIEDIRRADPQIYKKVEEKFCLIFKKRFFAAVILDRPLRQGNLEDCLEKFYEKKDLKLGGIQTFWTKTGLKLKPFFIYLPKR